MVFPDQDFEIISVLRNLKIIGIFTRLANRDNKKQYLKLIPHAWELIELRIKNKLHTITQVTWENFTYRIHDNQVVHEVTATFTQYPIKLAWAVTIHKSQGQTFENVILNLDTGSFAHGQTYVALSRVVSLEGLYLTRKIKMSDIIFNQNLQEYLT